MADKFSIRKALEAAKPPAGEAVKTPKTAVAYIAMAEYEGASSLRGTLLSVPKCWRGYDAFLNGPDADDNGIGPLPTEVGVYRCTLEWVTHPPTHPEDDWDCSFTVTRAERVWEMPDA